MSKRKKIQLTHSIPIKIYPSAKSSGIGNYKIYDTRKERGRENVVFLLEENSEPVASVRNRGFLIRFNKSKKTKINLETKERKDKIKKRLTFWQNLLHQPEEIRKKFLIFSVVFLMIIITTIWVLMLQNNILFSSSLLSISFQRPFLSSPSQDLERIQEILKNTFNPSSQSHQPLKLKPEQVKELEEKINLKIKTKNPDNKF